MPKQYGKLVFAFFLTSGFCGLLYKVIWLRLAYTHFVITPVISIVISVFMLGLGLGSWAGGRWIGPLKDHGRRVGTVGCRCFRRAPSLRTSAVRSGRHDHRPLPRVARKNAQTAIPRPRLIRTT